MPQKAMVINPHFADQNRFIKTFGVYDSIATVVGEDGWFHVSAEGLALYDARYDWCGNFQENFCAVRDKHQQYFHINSVGSRAYSTSYSHVGDFKDGIAVVCNTLGFSTHIDYFGNEIHSKFFIELDVFHEEYARAKDNNGWCHIDIAGNCLYDTRYAMVERFYNGLAKVETVEGALIMIDVHNTLVHEIRKPLQPSWQDLSSEMVGFWRTEVMAAAVKLKVFDALPETTAGVSGKLNIPEKHIERLLRALWELDLINHEDNRWVVTSKGYFFTPQSEKFLSAAAVMWSDSHNDNWKNLAKWIEEGYEKCHPVFKAHASQDKLLLYHQAIDGYLESELPIYIGPIDWRQHKKIVGIERNAKTVIEALSNTYSHLELSLLGDEYIFEGLDPTTVVFHKQSPLLPWPVAVDGIILPRILNHWPNSEAVMILNQARKALLPNGKIYLYEMLVNKQNPNGSLLDINMFVECGGELRTLVDWETIFAKADLTLTSNLALASSINLMVLEAI